MENPGDTAEMVAEFYKQSAVRERIREFLGGRAGRPCTARFAVSDWSFPTPSFVPEPVEFWLPPQGEKAELFRSLWDRNSLLADLDIEYVNFDFRAEAFFDPWRAFEIQRPVIGALQEILRTFGIRPLHFLTGRGHHFVWRVGRATRAYRRLIELGNAAGHVPSAAGLETVNWLPEWDDEERAWIGLGRVIEYLAHRLIRKAREKCSLSIQLSEIEVGSGRLGREMVCVDLSEYGDPLAVRTLRAPFSFYLKWKQLEGRVDTSLIQSVRPMAVLPVGELEETSVLEMMRDPWQAAKMAETVSAVIPEASAGTEAMINDYLLSSLGRFHEKFYSLPQEFEEDERAEISSLPICLRQILNQPNDLLLKPAALQAIVRGRYSQGWSPRRISGLIRRHYEAEHGWGDRWIWEDAAIRADFYTRLFSGMILTGLDELIDFNCQSHREKGYCFFESCTDNIGLLLEPARRRIAG